MPDKNRTMNKMRPKSPWYSSNPSEGRPHSLYMRCFFARQRSMGYGYGRGKSDTPLRRAAETNFSGFPVNRDLRKYQRKKTHGDRVSSGRPVDFGSTPREVRKSEKWRARTSAIGPFEPGLHRLICDFKIVSG